MRVAAVESTTLVTVSYNQARELLQLEFCSRAIYQYFHVPAAVHQSLLDASSKGRYFNQAIRGCFPYRRIADFDGAPRRAELAARCDR
ncbi:MAG TPA: KTSC domain-containing protein [Bryobacteraceae bacterium]|nr:KTSC domain-containing protein [Bryobacteraceae bacterium]